MGATSWLTVAPLRRGVVLSLSQCRCHRLQPLVPMTPWLAPGDMTEVLPNMVFSNEPGVYRPGRDGYRTINTMLVHADHVEIPSRFLADTPIDQRVIAL